MLFQPTSNDGLGDARHATAASLHRVSFSPFAARFFGSRPLLPLGYSPSNRRRIPFMLSCLAFGPVSAACKSSLIVRVVPRERDSPQFMCSVFGSSFSSGSTGEDQCYVLRTLMRFCGKLEVRSFTFNYRLIVICH